MRKLDKVELGYEHLPKQPRQKRYLRRMSDKAFEKAIQEVEEYVKRRDG